MLGAAENRMRWYIANTMSCGTPYPEEAVVEIPPSIFREWSDEVSLTCESGIEVCHKARGSTACERSSVLF